MSFDWEMYSALNPDLNKARLVTKQQIEKHFIRFAKAENRVHDIYQVYPDFKPEIYREIYCDLKNMNKRELELHWLRYGRYEGRRYIDNNLGDIIKKRKANSDMFYNFNMKYQNKTYILGLCFKIYVTTNTSVIRYNIIKEFLNSLQLLLNNYNNLIIVGVIDCEPTVELDEILTNYINSRINIIRLNKNRGISFATNIGIEYLLNKGCDVIFCSDDDVKIINSDVLNKYLQTMYTYKIPHLGFYPLINGTYPFGVILDQHEGLLIFKKGYSGAFYCLLAPVIHKYGYLPLLKAKYGYEHEIFTSAITGKQYDIINSNNYIELNQLSIDNKSGQNDINTEDQINCPLQKYVSKTYFTDSI
jgi:hypothetical protein